jgi:hypothetical protein
MSAHRKGQKDMATEARKGRRRSGTNQSAGGRGEHFATGSVTSQDGTLIGYRQPGRGPGVVLLHGTMSSGQNHFDLVGGAG